MRGPSVHFSFKERLLRKRCPAPTLTGQVGILAWAQGMRSPIFDAGQPLTSLVRVPASQACGFTSLSLQVSISEAMAAQLVAPSSLPAKSAFFRLCRSLHNRNYAQVRIMRSWLAVCAESPVDRPELNASSRSSCT